jgi:hypothetical protein
MKLTIDVPAKFVKLVNESFKDIADHNMTEKELIKFFEQDIREMYLNDDFESHVDDAMDAYLTAKYQIKRINI